MKIAILTLGTRGDIQYNIAIAKFIAENGGHTTTIISHKNFEDLVKSYGLSFLPLSINSEQILGNQEGKGVIQSGSNMLKLYQELKIFTKKYIMQLFKESYSLCKGYDIIIANQLGLVVGYHLAEKLQIPIVYIYSFPALARTKKFPSSVFPFQKIKNPLINLFTHILEEWLSNFFCRKEINKSRKEILQLSRLPWNFSYRLYNQKYIPILLSISRYVLPAPKEWEKKVYLSGYCLPEVRKKSSLTKEMKEFIDSGEPPVYIGFGSMNHAITKNHIDIFDTVLKNLNERGIFMNNWSKLESGLYSPNLLIAPPCDHNQLFHYMKIIIHHGGPSTLATTLESKKPSIIIPFFCDQFFWGMQAEKIGVSPPALPFKKFNTKRLQKRIYSVLSKKEYEENSKTIGLKIKEENSLESVKNFIENYYQNY